MQPHPGFQRSQYQSDQEKIVHMLTASAMGYRNSFVPQCIKKSKEPSDLVLLYDRVAILIYCKNSKNPSLKKSEQNICQGRKWVRFWESGEVLRGSNSFGNFEVDYEDVDQIVIASVVNGKFWGITKSRSKNYYTDRKVVCEVVIGFELLEFLCRCNTSAFEFLELISLMKVNSSVLPHPFVVNWVQRLLKFYSDGYGEKTPQESNNSLGEETWIEITRSIHSLKLNEMALRSGERIPVGHFGAKLTAFLVGTIHRAKEAVVRGGKVGTSRWIVRTAQIDGQEYSVFVSGNSAVMAGEVLDEIQRCDLTKNVVFSFVFDDQDGESLLFFGMPLPNLTEPDLSGVCKSLAEPQHF